MVCLFTYQAKIQIFCRVKLITWNLVNLSHFYFQFISNEKTNEAIAMNNTKSTEKSLSSLHPETTESAPNNFFEYFSSMANKLRCQPDYVR